MSVISPRDISEYGRSLEEDFGLDAWTLCRDFVERIVSEAQTAAERDNPGHPFPDVDWDSIWQAGEDAPTDELAIGRVIRAASEVARGILVATPEPLPRHAETGPVDDEVGAKSASTLEDAESDYSTAQAESVVGPAAAPVTSPVDTVSAPVEPDESMRTPGDPAPTRVEPVAMIVGPVAVPVEPVAVPVEPVAVPVEPVKLPVAETTSAVDSATSAHDDPRATTISAPADTEELVVVGTLVEADHEVDHEKADRELATERVDRIHTGWITFFTWTRNVGAIILLFVAWQLWGTAIAQHHAQEQLKTQFDAAVRAHHPPVAVAPGALIPAGTRFAPAEDGSVLARLQIPSIGVDQYVVEGTTSDDLAKGPGHYVGTALPGQAGNVAIAGHRTTHGAPFNGLGQLVRGDRIILTTTWGEHLTYVVTGTPQAVSPSDVAVLNYFGDNRITLTTCNPEFSSTQRLVAVGELDRSVKTPAAKHIAYHVVDPGTANWDWSLLPAVGVEICLLLLLGLTYQRFDVWFGRRGKWLILVPIWAAGLYLLFGTLTTFLPSSI